MRREVEVASDHRSVTVHIPLQLRRHGGRKVIIGEIRTTPAGKPAVQSSEHKTVLKALGRAYRWKRMLESGEFASIGDLAKAEKINHSYVRRILRLTLLSPEIIEMILDSEVLRGERLGTLLVGFTGIWVEQLDLLRYRRSSALRQQRTWPVKNS